MMQLSDHGEALIKNFEGLRLTAYRDAVGVWTIGYGSTRYHDGRAVKPLINWLMKHRLMPYFATPSALMPMQ